MTIRTDVTIDWQSSPRVLEVAAPSTEITIQDLYDTCRYFEDNASSEGMLHDFLISAGGKEFLGGTTYVGITATLNNATLQFEARGGPAWTLCIISGGNLVAVDSDGNIIDPRAPTAYVTVDRTASASATLQEQSAIQYGSFRNGGVTLDPENHTGKVETDTSNIDFPVGTDQAPCYTIEHALAVASKEGNGFKRINLESDLNITEAVDLTGFIIEGNNHVDTRLQIGTAATVSNVKVVQCTVHDTILDGNVDIDHCTVGNITYLNGHIHNSGLYGSIILDGDNESVIESCYTVDADDPVVIDMGGTGNDLSMPNYSGIVTIGNLTSATEEIGIGLNAGMVVLENTITAGTIVVAGNGILVDNSTGTSVNSDGLVNRSTIAEAVWSHLIQTGFPAEAVAKIMVAALAGKLSGAGGTTITIRDLLDSVDIITATVDEDGNRTEVTLNVP